ncbi:hypothetical protein HOLleu_31863 [Holothuria leucospilota]|uniref:Uncharacterized protein n=1 Tax=Holothuria leucospilota TaxID=206669 RepID=A0A9Q1BGK1_HOLLE|nr:hypothetical protein HOLleu_31863 [Holothuria leucospilota]
MEFPVKSYVQAIDPVCRIWFSARVTEVADNGARRRVKRTEYPSEPANWVPIADIRSKETKRICKVAKKLWPSQDPKFYQRGDKVVEVRPDGTDGDVLSVEQNDPWRCQMKCGDRLYRYEHLKEFEPRSPQTITPDKETAPQLESRQPSQSVQQSQHQATDLIPEHGTIEEPQQQTTENRDQSNTRGKKRKTQQRAKTVKVTKKVSTCND